MLLSSEERKHEMVEKNIQSDAVDAAVRNFAQVLRAVQRHAGDPSYRTIAKALTRHVHDDTSVAPVSTATLSRAFSGKAFPKWRTVESLLFGCGFKRSTTTYRKVRMEWLAVADLIDPLDVDVDVFGEDGEETDDSDGVDNTASGASARADLRLVANPVRTNIRPTGT